MVARALEQDGDSHLGLEIPSCPFVGPSKIPLLLLKGAMVGVRRFSTPERILRNRQSKERWKLRNWEYYVEQKRRLGARPEYRALRRAVYLAKRGDEPPKPRGRPRLYRDADAIECAKQQARERTRAWRAARLEATLKPCALEVVCGVQEYLSLDKAVHVVGPPSSPGGGGEREQVPL